jgi:cytochrome c-type biogenesis protein CcmH
MRALRRIVPIAAALAALACDRNLEPYDPSEQPRQPDLSKIFPAGAERAERAQPGLAPAPGMEERGAPAVAAEAGEPIHGTVRISPELVSRVPDGAVLFLIARNAAGGPPLAVKRIPSPSFPLEFELGADDRMIQAMPFAGEMTLSARIDADGNATSRTPGDLQGASAAPVRPGARGVEVLIDQALPDAPQGPGGA